MFDQQQYEEVSQQCRKHDAQLVVVSKYRDLQTIEAALAAGVTVLGESRVGIASQKKAALTGYDVDLHLIGHLQSRKTKQAVETFDMIQSVDSEKLLRKIDRVAGDQAKSMPVLLQLNLTGEPQKYGFTQNALADAIQLAKGLEHVDLHGLMCMGAHGDPDRTSMIYKQLSSYVSQYGLDECSMGMSDDYQIALAEGATMVRVGSLLIA